METKIFKGDKVKDPILFTVKKEIEDLYLKYGQRPGIAFVGFMNVPLGRYNIPFHVKSAEALGFRVINLVQPDDTSEEELLQMIDRLNEDPKIHTIEILQPLPPHINPLNVMSRISPGKEAEGFHPENMMFNLFPGYKNRWFIMCLPEALKRIFSYYEHRISENSEWLLVMDKEFMNNPLVNMVARTALQCSVPQSNSMMVINSDSKRLGEFVNRADYLVVVSKKPGVIHPDWLKEGAGIIDIYSNFIDEIPSKNDPSKLIPVISGGVITESMTGRASFIVPVPGGLMPVVLAQMFRNALESFKNVSNCNKLKAGLLHSLA